MLLRVGAGAMRSPVAKRSIYFGGRKTCASLEDAFWQGLIEIAGSRQMRMSELLSAIDAQRPKNSNLSSAIRLFVLEFYRKQVCDQET